MLIAVADLLEAEGRSLRHWSFRLAVTLGLVAVAGLVAVTGVAFLIIAAYLYCSSLWGPVTGALAVGVGSIFIAGITLWIAAARIK